jgi:hypothetical protein
MNVPFNHASSEAYIAGLEFGVLPPAATEGTDDEAAIPNIDDLPDVLADGNALLQFSSDIAPNIRSAVALSLLAAQRVASNSHDVETPTQWIDTHFGVLQNLNWNIESGGSIEKTFSETGVAVHEAILPFLATALGGAAALPLINSALTQLSEMDKNKPWITLFNRESVRFEVTEYQFGVVSSDETTTRINLATARFDARYGTTQILFFRLTEQTTTFEMANGTMSSENSLLTAINPMLRERLLDHSKRYIRSLNLG